MMITLKDQLIDILEDSRYLISDIKPSIWTQKYRVMTSEVSRFEGKFNYDQTPYCREMVDCLSPDHPARVIAVKKGAQIGVSTGVIESGIGWIISENPGNILLLSGHADLSEEAMSGKIDQMIDSCGLRQLIRPNTLRKKNMRTGDTNKSKEFPGGSLVAGSVGNHNLLRQRSVRYIFADDTDAGKKSSKSDGSTEKLILQRSAAYADIMKVYFLSSPGLESTSIIQPVYLKGDQRRYNVPCPVCHKHITIDWSISIEGNEGEKAGITWKLDNHGSLIPSSVGYVCQKCSNFFNDKNKYEMNLEGLWVPTAKPLTDGHYSYHISSLHAPPGMYDWAHYVNDYIEACPPGEKRKEYLYKPFVNLCLGDTYKEMVSEPKANSLQKNCIDYEIGILPEKISEEKHGNGKIIMITCACDLNGTEEDARLDWEIVAWTETESCYSIDHGSIGTFIFREGAKKYKSDRERWTYYHNRANSVWPELDKILSRIFTTDTGRRMKIFITGIDTGHFTQHAYSYIDNSNYSVVGLKGDESKYVKFNIDVPTFKLARERGNLYLVEVNLIKDNLADFMELKYDSGNDSHQPPGFMNYPLPSSGKYMFSNFFSHYESEHKEPKDGEDGNVYFRWTKKTTISQNHMWDVRIYNMVVKDIFAADVCKSEKIKNHTWRDYVRIVLGK